MRSKALLGVVVVCLFFVGGCVTGANPNNLIKTAAFDFNVPAEKVKILESQDEAGSGRYIVEVDGKPVKYKRMGTVYFQDK